MWGYPLWLFVGLWIVMMVQPVLDRDRIGRVVAAWAAVFTVLALAFVVNYTVLPRIDHRYRAEFFPGDALGAALTQRFHAATGQPLRYVIGSMWDGGNLAHYSPDQPQVLIDGEPARAPWIDLDDLRKDGAVVVWTQRRSQSAAGAIRRRRARCRSRRAVRSADAPRRWRRPCRLGDREAAVVVFRHPEVRAKRASKGDGRGRASFEARLRRAPQDDG